MPGLKYTKNLVVKSGMDDKKHSIETLIKSFTVVTDSAHRFVHTNDYTAKLLGFPSAAKLLQLTPYDIECPAQENADVFVQQNERVLSEKSPMTLLDIHTYDNQQTKSFITIKKPIMLNDDEQYVVCQCNEITNETMKTLLCTLNPTISHITPLTNISYQIVDQDSHQHFTQRQKEILYLAARGKTAKESAQILRLSYRTIEGYLDIIKDKLGVFTKKEVIEYAINHGYINKIPDSLLKVE